MPASCRIRKLKILLLGLITTGAFFGLSVSLGNNQKQINPESQISPAKNIQKMRPAFESETQSQVLTFKTLRIEHLGFKRRTHFSSQWCLGSKALKILQQSSHQSSRVKRFLVSSSLNPGHSHRAELDSGKCLTWNSNFIEWDYFAPECKVAGTFTLVTDTKDKSGSDRASPTVKFQINPTPVTVTGEFSYDSGNHTYPSRDCAPGQSEIELKNPNFTNLQTRHYFDSYLNIGLEKEIQANIQFVLKRPSFTGVDKPFREVNLPVGDYIFRYAGVDQFFFETSQGQKTTEQHTVEPFPFIKARILSQSNVFLYNERILHIGKASSFQGKLEALSWNLRMVGNNNLLFMEILPKWDSDEAPSSKTSLSTSSSSLSSSSSSGSLSLPGPPPPYFRSQVFQTPLLMQSDWAIGNLAPIENPVNLDELKKMYQERRISQDTTMKALTGPINYSVFHNLKLLEQEDPQTSDFFSQGGWRTSVKRLGGERWDWNQEVADLLATGQASRKFYSVLCDYWFRSFVYQGSPPSLGNPLEENQFFSNPKLELIEECQKQAKNPGIFFEHRNHIFFTEVVDALQLPYALSNRLTLSHYFQLQRNNSFGESESLGVDVSSSFKLDNWFFWNGRGAKKALSSLGSSSGNWLNFLGNKNFWLVNPQPLSTGAKWNLYKNFSEAQTGSSSNTVAQMTNFKLERLHFEFRVRGVRKCMSLRLNSLLVDEPYFFQAVRKDPQGLPRPQALEVLFKKGFLLCESSEKSESLQSAQKDFLLRESYYFFFLDENSNPTAIAPNTDLSRPFFMLVRGESDFVALIGNIHRQIEFPTYKHKDPSAEHFFGKEFQLLNLLKSYIPYTRPYQMKVSEDMIQDQSLLYSDRQNDGSFSKFQTLLHMDGLRGLRTFPGHFSWPQDLPNSQNK